MSTTPKYSWGDSVVVTDGEEVGSACAVTERDGGVFYTVEFPDGSDRLIAEECLSPIEQQ